MINIQVSWQFANERLVTVNRRWVFSFSWIVLLNYVFFPSSCFQREPPMALCKVKTGPSTWKYVTSLTRQRMGKWHQEISVCRELFCVSWSNSRRKPCHCLHNVLAMLGAGRRSLALALCLALCKAYLISPVTLVWSMFKLVSDVQLLFE